VKSLQKKQKTFTQRRKGATVAQRKPKEKTLRILCVSAPLRALLIFFFGCGSSALAKS
jgi:hypothetical protein